MGGFTQCRFAGQCDWGLASGWPPGASSGPLAQLRRAEGESAVIREELSRLFTVGERHRRLFARLVIAFGLSVVVFAVGTVLVWVFESGQKGGNIHGFGDAAFFCSVQLLTVSSSMTNPVTSAGKIIDVGLEAWAIFVVTAVAGSFATFFSTGDASLSASLRSWSLPCLAWTCGRRSCRSPDQSHVGCCRAGLTIRAECGTDLAERSQLPGPGCQRRTIPAR
jgi:hypothetical protein